MAVLSAFILPIEEKAFVFAHITRQNTFLKKKKTLKIKAPNSFFENESNFFYILSDFFNKFENLKLNKLVKEERRLDLDDRI